MKTTSNCQGNKEKQNEWEIIFNSEDLIIKIFLFLQPKEFINIKSSCKIFYNYFYNNNEIFILFTRNLTREMKDYCLKFYQNLFPEKKINNFKEGIIESKIFMKNLEEKMKKMVIEENQVSIEKKFIISYFFHQFDKILSVKEDQIKNLNQS